MANDTISLSAVFSVSPERLFDAWLDSVEHSRFTGGGKAVIEARVGGSYSVWDGYITGETREITRPHTIVQTWRSTEFPAGHQDSMLTVTFKPTSTGTRMTLTHGQVPEGDGEKYAQGWKEFYITPMQKYFARDAYTAGAPAKKKTAKKKAAAKKKSAPKKNAPKKSVKKSAKRAAKRAPAKKKARTKKRVRR